MSYSPGPPGNPSPYQRPVYQPGGPVPPPTQLPPGTSPPSGKKGGSTCLVLSIVFCVMMLFCFAGLGAMIVFGMWTESLPITQTDREVVIGAEAIGEYTDALNPSVAEETFYKEKYLDGSVELTYDYDDTMLDEGVYISYTIHVEKTKEDANTTYSLMWGVATASMKLGGGSSAGVEERNDIFAWGDRSRFGLITYDGQPAGNILTAQVGNKVIVFMLAGVYFDDGAFAEMARPYLEKARLYDPQVE